MKQYRVVYPDDYAGKYKPKYIIAHDDWLEAVKEVFDFGKGVKLVEEFNYEDKLLDELPE